MRGLAVFVYGTLMPGRLRWPFLEPFAVGSTPATARGRLYDTGLGYPATTFARDGEEVPGFVVDLDPRRVAAALQVLDAVEAEGVAYRRLEVVTSAGPAWSYEWLGDVEALKPLEGGWPAELEQGDHPLREV